jgi:hypothetical protein
MTVLTRCKPRQWPNGLGWNVKTRHGQATVINCVSMFRAYLPISPRREWLAEPLSGVPRWIEVGRHKVCDVPPGTDPIEALTLCREHGVTRDDGNQWDRKGNRDVPMVKAGSEVAE